MLSTILQHLVKENFNARFSTGSMSGSTEMTIEMEVTNQGQVQIDTKNLALCYKFINKCRKLINLEVEMIIVSFCPSLLIASPMKER